MTLNPTLHFVDSLEEALALKRWMGERRPYLAVDTETEGLQWWKHKPRLLQVGDPNEAWAIPWNTWGGLILEILREFDGDLVMHNMPFDIMMFEHWSGIKLPRQKIHDTRIQAHIDSPHLPTGLKPVAERLVDPTAAKSQRALLDAMKLHGWDWATVPLDFPLYWGYAGMDCILTSRVHEILHPRIMAECPLAYELEMRTGMVLIDMMFRGVAVDEEYTQEKLTAFHRYVDEASRWCEQEYGVKAGSNLKVVERLQRDIPSSIFEFTKLTPGGAFSLDKEVLAAVVEATHHPLAETVFQRRRIERVCSSYLEKFLLYAVDGRIHPNFNPVRRKNDDEEDVEGGYGARTGRMSVSEPPLQQLPRKSNDNPVAHVVRNCITASRDHTLVMCDWDQLEFRVYAHLCKDPKLIAAFSEGDFFVNMAREIFGDPTIGRDDARRQPTKNGAYAKIYGSGPDKFAKTVGTTVEGAKQFMAQLDATYPSMSAFNREIERVARLREETEGLAYVRSPLTQRRYVNDDGRYYALVDYICQGTATEVLKMKNCELSAAGLGEYLVLDVHDEMILDVPIDRSPEAGQVLHDLMYDANLFTVPLTASLSVAERWGGK